MSSYLPYPNFDSNYLSSNNISYNKLPDEDDFELGGKSPNITKKKDPLSDHEKHTNEENKYEKYFKENL